MTRLWCQLLSGEAWWREPWQERDGSEEVGAGIAPSALGPEQPHQQLLQGLRCPLQLDRLAVAPALAP